MNSSDEKTQGADAAQTGLGNSQSRVEGRCPFCGCATRQGAIKAAFWTSTGLLVVDEISAWLCESCGEASFETETAQRIQDLVVHPTGHIERKIPVSVYTMSRVLETRTHCRPRPSDLHRLRPAASIENAGQAVEPTKMARLHEPVTCEYCGSDTVEGLTQSAFWVGGELILVEGIAARVCSSCGERFYDEDTAGKIAAIGQGERTEGLAKREILVPILSVAHAGQVQAAAC